jgi:hypothetical protein
MAHGKTDDQAGSNGFAFVGVNSFISPTIHVGRSYVVDLFHLVSNIIQEGHKADDYG